MKFIAAPCALEDVWRPTELLSSASFSPFVIELHLRSCFFVVVVVVVVVAVVVVETSTRS